MEAPPPARAPHHRLVRVLLHALLLAPAAFLFALFVAIGHRNSGDNLVSQGILACVLTAPGAAGLVGSLALAATPDAARARGAWYVRLLRLAVALGALCAALWLALVCLVLVNARPAGGAAFALLYGGPLALALGSAALHLHDALRPPPRAVRNPAPPPA